MRQLEEGLQRVAESEQRHFIERRTVRFQDVDAAGLVFFARVFDYFHDAQVGLLRERNEPLETALRDRRWAAPLRSCRAEFLRPLHFGDTIDVAVVLIDLQETEFSLGYRIDKGDELCAVGLTRHVTVDPERFRRAPVPEGLRRALRG